MQTPESDFANLVAQYSAIEDPEERKAFLREYREALTGFSPADDANAVARKVRGAAPVPAALTRGGLEDLGLKADAAANDETPDFL